MVAQPLRVAGDTVSRVARVRWRDDLIVAVAVFVRPHKRIDRLFVLQRCAANVLIDASNQFLGHFCQGGCAVKRGNELRDCHLGLDGDVVKVGLQHDAGVND